MAKTSKQVSDQLKAYFLRDCVKALPNISFENITKAISKSAENISEYIQESPVDPNEWSNHFKAIETLMKMTAFQIKFYDYSSQLLNKELIADHHKLHPTLDDICSDFGGASLPEHYCIEFDDKD